MADSCWLIYGNSKVKIDADYEKIREELRFGRTFDAVTDDGVRLMVVPGPGVILATEKL